LTIVAPAHAAGAVKIVISAAGGTSNSVTYTFT
jgi:hypothetical protein